MLLLRNRRFGLCNRSNGMRVPAAAQQGLWPSTKQRPQRRNQTVCEIRLGHEFAAFRQGAAARVRMAGHHHDNHRRPPLANDMCKLEAVHLARNVGVGHEPMNLGLFFKEIERRVGIFGLQYVKSSIREVLGDEDPFMRFLFDQEDKGPIIRFRWAHGRILKS
jgi:hypothetical protein